MCKYGLMAQGMKVIGGATELTGRGDSFMQTGIFMREIGLMIKLMDMANISI